MKALNRFKNSRKNAIVFGVFGALNLGLAIAGLAAATGALVIGLSCASLVLGGIWSAVSGISIKRAVKAWKAGKQDEQEYVAQSKKQEKNRYKAATKSRKLAISAVKQTYKQDIKNKKIDFNQAKADYKESGKTLVDKETFVDKKLAYKNSSVDSKIEKNATLKSIPSKPTGYRLAKGLSIAGATLSAIVAVAGSAILFSQYNSADVHANESGMEQSDFIDPQTTTNNSIGLTIGGVSLAGAIAGSVVAGSAKKHQKRAIANYDYSSVIAKSAPPSPETDAACQPEEVDASETDAEEVEG